MRAPLPPGNRKRLTPAGGIGAVFIFSLLILGSVVPALAADLPPAAAGAGVASERQAVLRIGRIEAGPVRGRQLELRLSEPVGGAGPQLSLSAAGLELPALSLRLRALDWACQPVLDAGQRLRCEGEVRLAGRPQGRLAVDLSEAASRMDWSGGGRGVAVAKERQSPWRIDLRQVPLRWLEAFLASLWPEGRIAEGEVSGQVRLPEAAGLRVEAELRFAGLGFDTPDGRFAGAGLSMPLTLRYHDAAGGQRLGLEGRLTAGELLVAPVYLAVPASGVVFALEGEAPPGAPWRFPRWAFRDAGVLEASGDAALDATGELVRLSADWASADLRLLAERYLGGVLAPTGFGDLQLGGRGGGTFAYDEEGLRRLELELGNARAIDPRGRFSLAGVEGDLRWLRDEAVADSRLAWGAAALYGIGLDASHLDFRSARGQLDLASPMRTGVLGGELRLERFQWRPPRGAAPLRIEMGLALERLDLGALSQRLGWPPFEGSVGGVLEQAVYQDNRVVFGNGLAMTLFGGRVRLDDLSVERPFGIAPSLAANVRFDDIDLSPLTRAFGFGEITGRLDGRLRGLRLVDWSPVAFDARLLTDRQWKGRRRISQRAVQDISDLGGSGLVAGLQARLLRTFDDFGYERIGIGCVLKDNRCMMSGLKKRGDGFLIVEGRGLPRIEVVGFRREVDWPTLVDRLRAATRGESLRIE